MKSNAVAGWVVENVPKMTRAYMGEIARRDGIDTLDYVARVIRREMICDLERTRKSVAEIVGMYDSGLTVDEIAERLAARSQVVITVGDQKFTATEAERAALKMLEM